MHNLQPRKWSFTNRPWFLRCSSIFKTFLRCHKSILSKKKLSTAYYHFCLCSCKSFVNIFQINNQNKNKNLFQLFLHSFLFFCIFFLCVLVVFCLFKHACKHFLSALVNTVLRSRSRVYILFLIIILKCTHLLFLFFY